MTMVKKVIITSMIPHVWLSPARAIKLVEHIRDSLSADYPDKKATFEQECSCLYRKIASLG